MRGGGCLVTSLIFFVYTGPCDGSFFRPPWPLFFLAGCMPAAVSASTEVATLAQAPAQGYEGGGYEGRASWYGPGFAGRRTANGEVFDPSQMTAAHKTLPFGTQVRVTNLNNGLSTLVRINDRGAVQTGPHHRLVTRRRRANRHDRQRYGPGNARAYEHCRQRHACNRGRQQLDGLQCRVVALRARHLAAAEFGKRNGPLTGASRRHSLSRRRRHARLKNALQRTRRRYSRS